MRIADENAAPDVAHRFLDCGIAYDRIEMWLDDELGLPRAGEARWSFAEGESACEAALSHLGTETVGMFTFERTGLDIAGNAAGVERFYRLFTLRFLSAGG